MSATKKSNPGPPANASENRIALHRGSYPSNWEHFNGCNACALAELLRNFNGTPPAKVQGIGKALAFGLVGFSGIWEDGMKRI